MRPCRGHRPHSVWYSDFALQAEHGDWVARILALVPNDAALTGMAGMWAVLEGDQETALSLGEKAVAAAAPPMLRTLCSGGWR